VDVIVSHIEPPAHAAGGTQLGGKQNQKGDVELHHNDRFRLQLNKYYRQVMSALQDADSILIMGPGQAKIEFQKLVQRKKSMQKRILRVEAADKMTEKQMIARVRKAYREQSAS
jgi:stalled ribosome rescue protein Dom34